MYKFLLTVGALISSVGAYAQDDAPPSPSEMPERISFLVAFGEEKCREPEGDEIVVIRPGLLPTQCEYGAREKSLVRMALVS